MEAVKSKIPELRFPEFGGEWEEKLFGKILISSKLGGNYSNSELPNDKPLIKMGNLGRGNIKLDKVEYIDESEIINDKDKIQEGDLFFNTRNTLDLVGKVAVWKCELEAAYYNSNLMYIKFDNNYFMNYRLNSYQGIKGLRRLATGTTSVAAIYSKDLLKLGLSIPHLPEQQKIASFLTAVDDKIQQLTKKKSLLELYKKGVMQKIFSQEIRFKPALSGVEGDEDGKEFAEWEVKKLGEVFNRVISKNLENNKNVMTISAQQGLINQEKFFKKSVSAKDVTGYYLLQKGDFAYNKSYSNGYPMGATKRLNRYEKGVVSTLYICFRIKENQHSNFYEHYFNSGFMNKELHKIAQEGARNHGLLNMSVVEFFDSIKIPNLSLSEQQKIANFLTAIDHKIEQVNTQLDKTKAFKKGLLQKMFV